MRKQPPLWTTCLLYALAKSCLVAFEQNHTDTKARLLQLPLEPAQDLWRGPAHQPMDTAQPGPH